MEILAGVRGLPLLTGRSGPQNPTCDPRGPGSVLISVGSLARTQGGPSVGSVSTYCTTTRKVGADYYGYCVDVLYTPEGVFRGPRGDQRDGARAVRAAVAAARAAGRVADGPADRVPERVRAHGPAALTA